MNRIRSLINAITGTPNYDAAEDCMTEFHEELNNNLVQASVTTTVVAVQNTVVPFVPRGLIPVVPDHPVPGQKYFLDDLVGPYGPYDHILSFLRRPLKFVSVKIMLHAIRSRAFSVTKGQKYMNMIIDHRLPQKNVTEVDVFNLQDQTGITNEEIMDYIITNKDSPKVDGLLELLYDLIDPQMMTQIVYSKRSLSLLKKTWSKLFATDSIENNSRSGNIGNQLHIFLGNFDIECYRFILREHREYLAEIMRRPLTDWLPGYGEIVHTKFLAAALDQGLNSLAEDIIDKYSVPEADFTLALSCLLRENLFKAILFLYDSIPCADLQIASRDLLGVPIELQDEDFKMVLMNVVNRQIASNELYVLLFIHFTPDRMPIVPDDRIENIKKIVKKIGPEPFSSNGSNNYDYIMQL